VALSASGDTLTGRAVLWTSLNPSIATVDLATGLVTGVAPGTATIRATSEGQTGDATITVSAPQPPPAAPSGLTASFDGPVYVDWRDNSTNETRFEVERKTGEAGTYAQIATIPGDTGQFRRYVDRNVTDNGTVYYYRVRACNTGGCSAYDEASTAAPTVSTGAATNIRRNNLGSGDATISGHVDPNANDYMVWFEYRSGYLSGSDFYPSSGTSQTREVAGTAEQDWQANISITDESQGAAYRIVARSFGTGISYGAWKCINFFTEQTTQNFTCNVQEVSSSRIGTSSPTISSQSRSLGSRTRISPPRAPPTATPPRATRPRSRS
jgi:hypothetical protein